MRPARLRRKRRLLSPSWDFLGSCLASLPTVLLRHRVVVVHRVVVRVAGALEAAEGLLSLHLLVETLGVRWPCRVVVAPACP